MKIHAARDVKIEAAVDRANLGIFFILLSVYCPNETMPNVARNERISPISYIAPGKIADINKTEAKSDVNE